MSYVPIRLSTIKPEKGLDFNVYLKLNTKFLLYIRTGDGLDRDRYKKLKDKKVRQLFIESDDEERYQAFLDSALSAAMDDPNMSNEDRANTAVGVGRAAVEDIHEDPESRSAYAMVERAAKGIVNIVGKKSGVLKEFVQKLKGSEAAVIFKHALSVSSLATCFGEYLGIEDEELQNISTAAMMMDVGMMNMPEDKNHLFTTDYSEFSKEDWDLYKTHPKHSYDLLCEKEWVSPAVLDLILNHEERKSGDGFPNGKMDLNLAHQVLALCSSYDRRVTCLGQDRKEALKDIQINELGNFDLDTIKKFKKVLELQGMAS